MKFFINCVVQEDKKAVSVPSPDLIFYMGAGFQNLKLAFSLEISMKY